jgi:hypothetical protein
MKEFNAGHAFIVKASNVKHALQCMTQGDSMNRSFIFINVVEHSSVSTIALHDATPFTPFLLVNTERRLLDHWRH